MPVETPTRPSTEETVVEYLGFQWIRRCAAVVYSAVLCYLGLLALALVSTSAGSGSELRNRECKVEDDESKG
ncbi:hypothetical protein BJX76DRAFT_332885 [Aspergillus varians]